jgi:hypothetical protein
MHERATIKLDNIFLDIENPRFASYFERTGKNNPTQNDVVTYLEKYESIDILAERIKTVGGLHPTELLACLREGTTYVVLEGNRRVCACKKNSPAI